MYAPLSCALAPLRTRTKTRTTVEVAVVQTRSRVRDWLSPDTCPDSRARAAREIARGNGAIPRRDSQGSPCDSLTRRDSVSCHTFLLQGRTCCVPAGSSMWPESSAHPWPGRSSAEAHAHCALPRPEPCRLLIGPPTISRDSSRATRPPAFPRRPHHGLQHTDPRCHPRSLTVTRRKLSRSRTTSSEASSRPSRANPYPVVFATRSPSMRMGLWLHLCRLTMRRLAALSKDASII